MFPKKASLVLSYLVIILLTAVNLSYASTLKQIFEEGVLAFTKGEHEKALTLFEKSLEVYPEFAPSLNYIGLTKREMGESSESVDEYYKRAIASDPSYVLSYENLCKSRYQAGEFDEAEEYCLKALNFNPELEGARLTLAWVYLVGKNDPREAIDHFEKVYAKINNNYATLGLGMAYFLDNQRPRVLEMITKLRIEGNEALAAELEKSIRENNYLRPTSFQETAPRRTVSTIIKDDPASFPTSSGPGSDIKVRLNKKMPRLSSSSTPVTHTRASSNGSDRIKALQQNSQSKGSGY